MFVTKQIIHKQLSKSQLPHKKQILKEIKASHNDETWKIDNFYYPSRPKSVKSKQKRPDTAITIKSYTRKSTSDQPRTQTEISEQQNCDYLKKVNYQFNQINEIANLFDNKFDFKEKKLKKQRALPQRVNLIKKMISVKEKEHKQHYEKMKRVLATKLTQTEPNIYMGFSQQKVKTIIPISTAKDEDMAMLIRYIKGGYVSEAEEYSEKQNKAQVVKLKKRFVTMKTLYDAVRGKKNKGIQHVRPQSIDRNSLQNYVYYLENEKTLKIQDKLAIQHKIKLIS